MIETHGFSVIQASFSPPQRLRWLEVAAPGYLNNMPRTSAKQLGLISLSVADVARYLARAHAARQEQKLSGASGRWATFVESLRRGREPKHVSRNVALVVVGAVGVVVAAFEIVGRRTSWGVSPLKEGGSAARDATRQDEGAVTNAAVAGVAAAEAVADAAEQDVRVGVETAKHAVTEVAKEHVVRPATRKAVKLAVIAVAAGSFYVLVMAVLIALLVDWVI